jgi:hypothetical protein
MGKTVTVWLDDEAEHALEVIKSRGVAESDAIRKAIIEAAAHTKLRTKVNDPDVLEQALEKSHETIAEVFATQRPPR